MSRKSRKHASQEAAARNAAAQKRSHTLLALVIVLAVVMLGAGTILLNGWDRKAETPQELLSGKQYVEIDVADHGVITVELDADAAPITVTNFVGLANEGFYDGLTFHRIISGFMIQGGDPNGNGSGGSGKNIRGEFSRNGVNNPITHERGVISMARSNAPDSASSQFFIVHEKAAHLDGQYAAFGHVLSGMEIVDEICASTPVTDDNGTVLKQNQPIITSIRVIEKPAEGQEEAQ